MNESELRDLLKEGVEKLARYAKRQGPRRMAGKSFGEGTRPNPNPNSHYPAVQSFLDRARKALRQRTTS